MKLSNDELNITLDGLQDTLIRNERGELPQERFNYVKQVMLLKKRVERQLSLNR